MYTPFLRGIYLSFCKFTTTSNATWIGIDNYLKAFRDAGFMYSFWYTALFAIVSLLIINVLAFAVAYALTRGIRGSNLFRTVFFMPNLIGGIVLGYIWSMIFDGILIRYGTSILLETKYGFWGLIILMCWQQIGYMMIIYIAGLQSVPEELIEAARIDGANGWHTLTRITIPCVMPSITICTFLSLTNGFKLFDQNLALNGGQPFKFLADGQHRQDDRDARAQHLQHVLSERQLPRRRPGQGGHLLCGGRGHRPHPAPRDPQQGGAAVMEAKLRPYHARRTGASRRSRRCSS